MGIFKRMKDGISSKANAALDKAIDPEKEIDMAILELEEGRKKALQELISYKATARQMEDEIAKQKERAAGWEKKAMIAVRAGDDEAARLALREKKNCEVEIVKITRDRDEAASYAIQLNKSRKEFETKLQILKLRKGTLATQLAAARSASGDAFGNDGEVWEKFERAEQRIDEEAIATEVDAAMRGEQAAEAELDAAILNAGHRAGSLGAGAAAGVGAATSADDALAEIKKKVAAEKERRAAAIAAAQQKALGDGKDDK
jgi:phage shock protein A